MLARLRAKGFKSLADVALDFPRLAVLFGANAAGKSNLLDAVQILSRVGTARTLSDALSEPIRGHPIEAFSFPPSGLAGLLSQETTAFQIEADVALERERYRYRVDVGIQPSSGKLALRDEYLTALRPNGEPKGLPAIEAVEGKLRLRRKSHPGKPRYEHLGQNYACLSDPRLSSPEYRAIERCRSELTGWRTYYLDPRVAMRSSRPPAEVGDIGVLGEDIAPFLYRLREEEPKRYAALTRTLRSIVPNVESLAVDLDKRRGTLDILIRQDGVDFSSRIVSEGTLRVLALSAVAVNPWSGSLLAFEEPENGVHPRRLELIAKLLASLACSQGRQVIVTTHSPLFCDAMLREARERPEDIALFNVRRFSGSTRVQRFESSGPLFQEQAIAHGLRADAEDGVFESLILRGLIDE